jgi:hypothetical protein
MINLRDNYTRLTLILGLIVVGLLISAATLDTLFLATVAAAIIGRYAYVGGAYMNRRPAGPDDPLYIRRLEGLLDDNEVLKVRIYELRHEDGMISAEAVADLMGDNENLKQELDKVREALYHEREITKTLTNNITPEQFGK